LFGEDHKLPSIEAGTGKEKTSLTTRLRNLIVTSLFVRNLLGTKGKQREVTSNGKCMSKKSVVEIGRRAIKPSDSSSGELALCTESEFDDERAMRINLMLNVYTRQDFSLKTMTIKRRLIWTYITCVNSLCRAFVCGRLERTDASLLWPQKFLLWPPNLFTVASHTCYGNFIV